MSAVGALLSPEGEEELHRQTAEVERAYARVHEHAPAELKGGAAPTRAEILTALRTASSKNVTSTALLGG